jgi:hypothetical protein
MAPKAPLARHAAAPAPRRSKFAALTGLVLGSALAALAMSDGARVRIGSGLPGWLSLFLGGVVVWLVVVAATAVIAEVLRRNRSAIGRSAGRQARRAGRAGRRHGGRMRRAAIRRGAAWAGPRWQARNGPASTGTTTAADDAGTATGAGDAVDEDAGDLPPGPGGDAYPEHPVYGRGPWLLRGRSRSGRVIDPLGNGGRGSSEGVTTVHDPADLDRRLAVASYDPDLQAQVRPLPRGDDTDPGWPAWDDGPAAGGGPGSPDPAAGHPAGDATTESGGTDMTTDTYRPGAPRRARRVDADVAVTWKQLVAATGDFEPETDSHLMDWMAGEAAGMTTYAESITDVYETAVNTVGLDPVAMQALHEYAEAAAEAGNAMADARARFAAHYQAVREFTAAGGVMPHDGRWITGEGE